MADEPVFMAFDGTNAEYKACVAEAQKNLAEFVALMNLARLTGSTPFIKTLIRDGEHEAFLWLSKVKPTDSGFDAEVFEIPRAFREFHVGDTVHVPREEVVDWMINQRGLLFGGFSLRYQRSLLPEEKRSWFDEQIGVKKYA